MAIDGYFLNAQIKELKPLVLNGKLRKITSEPNMSIGLDFFNKGQNIVLLLNASPNSPHMRIINEPFQESSTNFVNLLKKELLNSTLIKISQHKRDRIIYFDFLKRDPFLGSVKKTLIFEVMGRNSNIILVDDKMVILDASKKQFSEDARSVLPNIKYEPFPTSKNVFEFSNLKELSNPEELFQQYMGFSREFAHFIYNNRLDPETLEINPTIYKNNKISFHAYDLKLEGSKLDFKTTSSLLKHYYDSTLKSDDHLIKLLLKQQKRLTSKLNNLSLELDKNKNYHHYKNVADQIYSSSLNLTSYKKSFQGQKLNSDLTLNENAQNLYDKYKKLKRSISLLKTKIQETENQLQYFDDLIASFETFNKNDLVDLKQELRELGLIKKKKPRQQKLKHYLTFKLDNATCLVGKTAKQNEEIVTKLSFGEDYWFHVKDYPGAHVVLKGNKSEENIKFAAEQALMHSPLNKLKKGYVQYTKIKYVKKIKERLGFYVTYKNAKTLFVTL